MSRRPCGCPVSSPTPRATFPSSSKHPTSTQPGWYRPWPTPPISMPTNSASRCSPRNRSWSRQVCRDSCVRATRPPSPLRYRMLPTRRPSAMPSSNSSTRAPAMSLPLATSTKRCNPWAPTPSPSTGPCRRICLSSDSASRLPTMCLAMASRSCCLYSSPSRL